MQRAIESAALDQLARDELRREWQRHRATLAAMRAGEPTALVGEFERHMDHVELILASLAARLRSAIPAA